MGSEVVRVARWDDPRYAHRVAGWERLNAAATPFLLDALRLLPGDRVLDVGCGTGAATLRAAEAVGERGTVIGVDISASVVEWATRRAAASAAGNVAFLTGDAQRCVFAGGPFTAAMSQFGVMFFDDPVAGFANIRRHLVTGGRLCFTCWQAAAGNPWSFGAILADLLPQPPAPAGRGPAPGPFALAGESRLRGIVQAAGFAEARVAEHHVAVRVPEDTIVDDDELTLMGVPGDRLGEAWDRVTAQLAPYRSDGGMLRLPLAFFVVSAR